MIIQQQNSAILFSIHPYIKVKCEVIENTRQGASDGKCHTVFVAGASVEAWGAAGLEQFPPSYHET